MNRIQFTLLFATLPNVSVSEPRRETFCHSGSCEPNNAPSCQSSATASSAMVVCSTTTRLAAPVGIPSGSSRGCRLSDVSSPQPLVRDSGVYQGGNAFCRRLSTRLISAMRLLGSRVFDVTDARCS